MEQLMDASGASTQEHLKHALAAAKAGERERAMQHAEAACGADDTPAQLRAECARIAAACGQHARAAQWYAQVLQQLPSKAIRFAHGVALMESGELEGAEAAMRQALAKSPRELQFLNLLGVVLKRRGGIDEAMQCFRQAARAEPKNPSPWVNLGNCQMTLGQPEQAAESFERACKLAPGEAENHRLLGSAWAAANKRKKALAALRVAQSRGSRNPWTPLEIANILCLEQQFDAALETVDAAIPQFPGNVDLQRMRASILRRSGRIAEAQALFEYILRQHPDDVETLVMFGNLHLWGLNQRREANALYERALALKPNHIEAARNYCDSLSNSRHDNEMVHFEKAYEVGCGLLERVRNPLHVAGTLQRIFLRAVDYERCDRLGDRATLIRQWVDEMNVGHLHNQLGRVQDMKDRRLLLDVHRAWGDRVQALAAAQPLQRRASTRKRDGRIRIGFMSSDLRHHPVTYFVLPLLEGYDRSRFELYCYSFYPGEADAVQKHIAASVSEFRVIREASDRQIAQVIADDELDILFELGGTTLLNRVQVCAWRPAPVQVSWLGYPHSAGLSHIDYILVDPWNKPVDDGLLLEKPFLVPETWVTIGKLGFTDIPIEAGIPEQRSGHLCFGTANNPYKYTRECFAAWARVLQSNPGSTFLFIRPEGGTRPFRENVLKLFAAHGVAPGRIEFEAVRGTHMPHYNRIDIALDPFPHVGGTTTCESLWMGVPVVTLAGPAFFERLSASNLHNAGLGDLCAGDVEEYIAIANALAADPQRRLQLRHGLRQQIRENPLGQPERFTRNFEETVLRVLA
jgi:protein O-GlcNAc transferase